MGGWSFTHVPEAVSRMSLHWLQSWHGDGTFVFADTPQQQRFVNSLRIPAVNFSAYLSKPILPTVNVDHRAIGRCAAEYFLSRRFRNLAYYGVEDIYYSEERYSGFVQGVGSRAAMEKLLVPLPKERSFSWQKSRKALETWLRSLVPPVGILCSSDQRALMLLQVCQELGLSVPHQIAILGVDDDPLVCNHSHPQLSSIPRNDVEVGRQAAALLESLMNGAKQRGEWVFVPPGNVVSRQSTATFAVEDPVIVESLKWIRANIDKPFGSSEVADMSSISRRLFEIRFREAMGCSPYFFISQQRIEHAKSLLEDPKGMPLRQIYRACGFTSPRRFRLVFHRFAGVFPKKWKASH
jgi:LacI family transcriptional regulator